MKQRTRWIGQVWVEVDEMFAPARAAIGTCRRAFTLLEMIAILAVLAILAGIAAPRIMSMGEGAKTSSLKQALSTVRSEISEFSADSSFDGKLRYPTHSELLTPGRVVAGQLPQNPYNERWGVEEVTSLTEASARAVSGNSGWRYYVDNQADPPIAIFWANCDDETADTNGAGAAITANDQ